MTVGLRCDRLVAGYSGVPVVRDLSLEVAPGEIVALLGPNGAGKTTTLLAISGFLAPISGRVEVLGAGVRPGRPHLTARMGLAFVPDDRSLFYGLTVRENLRLGVRGRRRNRDAGVGEALDYFPALEPLLDRRAGLLSGGEQQMLAIARALSRKPQALLMDEMSLGLAPVIVERLVPVVRRIADELGTAILLVEQHVASALEVADKAYVLSHGNLVLSETAAKLRTRRDLLQSSYLGDSTGDRVVL